MSLRAISAETFAALDKHLMSSQGAYTLPQLMELAGLSVSQALYKIHPPTSGPRVLIACGPGNNGGDGLVAARHLVSYGYTPTVYYPKPSKTAHQSALVTQLQNMAVPIVSDVNDLVSADHTDRLRGFDAVVDAVFGASFDAAGDVREPFPAIIAALAGTAVPVLAVDAPSGWDIQSGAPERDGHCARGYMPTALISLTAPKPLVEYFTGRHFVGGRFLTRQVADEFGIDVPRYAGVDQVVEVPVSHIRF